MRKTNIILILFVLPLFLFPGKCQAQTKAEIKNIDFNVVNDSLIVTYDLLKAKINERFNVVLVVKTVTGKTYDPVALSGDVGNNIAGGKGKRIVWDVGKDKVLVNDEIFVQVLATPVPPEIAATPVQEPPKETVSEKPKEPEQKPRSEEKVYSKGAAIALSAVLPGLGITKLRDGGPYWLIGIATYGCAIAGVVLNLSSSSSYNQYKNATDYSERDKYYNAAVSQNNTGNTLLWVAGGLWVADLIVTAVIPAKLKFGYSLGPTYNPDVNQVMLTLRCRIGKK